MDRPIASIAAFQDSLTKEIHDKSIVLAASEAGIDALCVNLGKLQGFPVGSAVPRQLREADCFGADRVPRTLGSSLRTVQNSLRQGALLCDNYVMRSTRNVVGAKQGTLVGQYSDPPLLVLASLASGPKHGHAMIEDIASLCGNHLGPGTLYGAIARLEQQGWIEPLPPEERRQPYRITSAGKSVLRAKLITLQRFSNAALRRLEAL